MADPYTKADAFSIVITLQLTVFMQLKCSFSIVVIFNGPSSGVCPLYNILSLGVKGTSGVL